MDEQSTIRAAQHRHATDISTGAFLARGGMAFPVYRVLLVLSLRLMAPCWAAFAFMVPCLFANVLSGPHTLVGDIMLLDKSQIPPAHNVVNMFVLIKGGADRFITFVEDVIGGKERTAVRTPDKDGTLIHAEIQFGDSTLMLADSKPTWPYTPAFIQVYVQDAQVVLDRAQHAGAEVVTEVSTFYNGFRLARMKDPWGNIWWLYEPSHEKQLSKPTSNVG